MFWILLKQEMARCQRRKSNCNKSRFKSTGNGNLTAMLLKNLQKLTGNGDIINKGKAKSILIQKIR
jgi:hypothetical protein